MAKKQVVKQKAKLPVEGRVYVTATFNNTIVTVTDNTGSVIRTGSAGTAGFKGTRKSTPFAATTTVQNVAQDIKTRGMEKVDVFVKGIGMGRDAAVRALRAAGIEVTSIADISPIPHNGCRPRKRRRV
ncbi:30S ribosomal protein S11 [candidate division WWE3 bacterium CG_4_9_14_3_um_filter_41_6]|uniref:Small ribosomal subunit protein uS11 n=1 Tax=candidate division WWE3 bacterium CG_4_10_14_0_2_um_filter_41_14 TaxID=1975072 RepID=A0A2M7TJX4_UNCKA|nr:MAG: 30S ribosomal protein S11 [candidate division WWE3 bacterium CG_4_10_14_0_2_um_filter_41_14]PJA39395.1 MAG: 30S ribosomal protein S11 [candidate division WWE3 bacterium CG_4_9_14_3_um_filter_41_6]